MHLTKKILLALAVALVAAVALSAYAGDCAERVAEGPIICIECFAEGCSSWECRLRCLCWPWVNDAVELGKALVRLEPARFTTGG